MKKLLAFVLAAMMLFGLAACSNSNSDANGNKVETGTNNEAGTAGSEAQGETASVHRDELRVALAGEPDVLNPYGCSHAASLMTTLLVYERLMKTTPDGEIVPWLATEWEMVDDTTLHLTLRDDVYFTDGSKFTAEDCAFSLKTAAESSFTTNLFGCIDVEGFVINSDTDLIVKLKTPNAALIPALAGVRAVMVSKNYFETASAEDIGRKPMGTGPMKFVEWVAGDHYTLEKNENYWGEPLAYDKATFRFITEASSRCIELETGGVDIAHDLASGDWERVASNPNLKLISGDTLDTRFLCFNQTIEPFNDINVRKGLAYALDFEALVNVVWEGTAVVAKSYYSPAIMGYRAVGPQEYNPELAKEYLAKAGYDESNPLKFVYNTYENNVNVTFAEMLQSMWKEVGVEIEVHVTDLSTFASMNNNAELNVSLLSTTASMADPSAALLLWPVARTISIRHNDQVVQDYLDEGLKTYDQEKRAEVYGELQEYLWEKFYAVPVCHTQAGYGCASYVENLPFYPNLIYELEYVTFSK